MNARISRELTPPGRAKKPHQFESKSCEPGHAPPGTGVHAYTPGRTRQVTRGSVRVDFARDPGHQRHRLGMIDAI